MDVCMVFLHANMLVCPTGSASFLLLHWKQGFLLLWPSGRYHLHKHCYLNFTLRIEVLGLTLKFIRCIAKSFNFFKYKVLEHL